MFRKTLKAEKANCTYVGDNRAHKAPGPESIDICRTYAISINPEDARQPDVTSLSGVADFISGANRFFSKLSNISVILYVEVSSMGRWHFHGLIGFNNVIKAYTIDLPRIRNEYGATYEIDTFNYEFPSYWLLYCTKQAELMADYLQCEHKNVNRYVIDTINFREPLGKIPHKF